MTQKISHTYAKGQLTELCREYTKDPKIFERFGFYNAGPDGITGETMWRLKMPYYHAEIQLTVKPYPKSNPNCGIVSIHHKAEEAEVIGSRKNKKVKFPERTTPIAWYVDNYERLMNIIISLTHVNI